MSPLRYPGGKTKIYERVKNLITTCHYTGRTYVEPFAGGFGIGLKLLSEEVIESAVLNDIDRHIFHFWHSVLRNTDALCEMIEDITISIEERANQKLIYANEESTSLEDGFATLFLNRVNYSGVIKGGPIGGLEQGGEYGLDCRFNKEDIIRRIQAVAALKCRIKLRNNDAIKIINDSAKNKFGECLLYIDPPYVIKGSQLYTNYYKENDHIKLAKRISRVLQRDVPWFMTYDDSDLIKEAYQDFHIENYDLIHNAGGSVKGKEIVITNIPDDLFSW
jgi:DNA adenine methylase